MVIVIVALSILLTILLSLVILAQDGKGGGFTPSAAGAAQVMGVKKTTDVLEKLTWGFIAAIIVVSVSSGFVTGGEDVAEGEIPTTVNMQKAKATAPRQAPATAAPTTDTAATAPTADPAK